MLIDSTLTRRLGSYLAVHSRGLIAMYTLALLNVACTITIPILMQVAIDRAIVPGELSRLPPLVGALAGVILVLYLSGRGQGILMMKIGYRVLYALRRDVFARLQNLSFRFYDTHRTGEIMSRTTNDIQVLEELLRAGLDTVVVDVFMILGLIVAMLTLDLRLSLVLVVTLPLFLIIVFGLQARLVRAGRRIQDTLSGVNAFLNESISGIKVIRAFAREGENIRRFSTVNHEYYREARTFYPLIAWFWQSVATLALVGTALVLLGGGLLLQRDLITIGVIAAFLVYINRFFQPLQKISNMLNQLSRAVASAERIFAIMDEPLDVDDTPPAVPAAPKDLRGYVTFDDVWFAYENDDHVVQEVTFEVVPGETIAIVGATGAGKTTIINLLCRFYDPLRGKVLVDGRDIREYPQQWYRSQLALVMQDAGIFSGTVRDNIRFGQPQASDDEILQVCRTMGIDTLMAELPHGLETEVGERGSNLSIGLRQVVAFARGLIHDPRILILDEAGAYLDSRTEALVHHAMDTLRQGRTTFVIAHRLATIREADTILVMHQGRIVERGTHEELAAHQGRYADLLRHQR